MMRKWQFTLLGAAFAAGLLFVGTRAGVRTRSVKTGSVHPVLSIPRARLGGIVREVLVKTGDHVDAGQVLMRFEARELENRLVQLRRAAQASEAMSQIPNQVRQYLYEAHPDTLKAERDYVDALAAFEQSGTGKAQLQQASAERMSVRRRLAKLFAGGASGVDSRAEIGKSIAEVEKMLADAEVRAPSRAVVDLLEAHAGDRIQPGQPLAVLVSAAEFSVEFPMSKIEAKQLQVAAILKGQLDGGGQQIEGRVESISTRKLPVIARDNLQTAEEPVVRLRILSSVPFRAGATVSFELP